MLCGLAVTHIVAHISTVTLLWEGQKRKGKLLSAVHVQSIEMIKAFYTLWQTWSTERLLFLPPSHAVNNSRWVFVHKYPPISIESSVQLSELEQCRRCPRFDPDNTRFKPDALTLSHSAPQATGKPRRAGYARSVDILSVAALWWSQIRPVQDSYESGTATVSVPDSYRARIRLCY